MKKIILILYMFSLNLFGYYSSDAMIDLLVQPNQLRVRTDRVGAVFGNENIRAAIGLTGANNLSGIILHNVTDFSELNNNKIALDNIVPALLGGIGYRMNIFGIALGYEFKWSSPTYMIHTPILSMTALDNNFRVNIPISVGVGQQSYYKKNDSLKGTIVVSTAFEGRYYFNTKYFSHLRLYFGYGNATIEEVNDSSIYFTQESVGFQLRAYFNYDFSSYNMKLTPIIRLQFDTALATKYNNLHKSINIVDNYYITAKGFAPSGGSRIGGVSVSSGANADFNNGELTDDKGTRTYYYSDENDKDIQVREGQFQNGMLSGSGKVTNTYKSGNLKTAVTESDDWKEDLIQGNGKSTAYYTNGDIKVYEGEYKDDKWNGSGTLTYIYADGTYYYQEGIAADNHFTPSITINYDKDGNELSREES